MGKTPQEEGFEFEEMWASVLGGRVTPGSGNMWFAKMDVETEGVILFGLKHTREDRYVINEKIVREVIEAAAKNGAMPGWAFSILDRQFVMLDAQDFLKIVQEEIKIAPATKNEEKMARARVPLILRREQENAS